jgi:hypothetical protein
MAPSPSPIKQYFANQLVLERIMLEEIQDHEKAIRAIAKVVNALLNHMQHLEKFISVSDAKVSIRSNHDLLITADGSMELKAANNLSLKATRIKTDAQIP